MPLDSTIPQDVPVVARQAGGRVLESESLLWKTLFPSGTLRIDGRVAVDQSSQYLLQMRMNSTKELIAVAFAPPSEPESLAFRFLMDHLLGKQYVISSFISYRYIDDWFAGDTDLCFLGGKAQKIQEKSFTSSPCCLPIRFRITWSS